MKKTLSVILLSIVIILLFTVFITKMYGKSELPEIALSKSFSYSGARVLSSEVYFWGKMNPKSNSMDEVKQLADSFSKELGIKNDHTLSVSSAENDFSKKAEVRGINSNSDIVDIVVQLSKLDSGKNEKTVSVSVVKDSSSAGLDDIRKNVLKVFNQYGIKPEVNSCITGCFDGKVENDRLNGICQDIFKEVEARKVEGMRDRNLISVSAYTPVIGNSIKVSGNKVNLNLAIRYNSLEDRTYIWLATPVITTEY